ncbi:MAG: sigma-70 family RNA polymerase sigma factor [Planctomycetota bacterium]
MSSEKNMQADEDFVAIFNDARIGIVHAETELHRQYVGRLVKLASRKINQRFRSKIDPDEVVQSVFASFFRRAADGDFELNTWNDLWALLVTITLRKCRTKTTGFRTLKRNVAREQSISPGKSESSIHIRSSEPSPEESALFNETLDQLFDLLSPLQQSIVSLRLQGYSNVEISQQIGRTERTVYRALKQVREVFVQFESDDEPPDDELPDDESSE